MTQIKRSDWLINKFGRFLPLKTFLLLQMNMASLYSYAENRVTWTVNSWGFVKTTLNGVSMSDDTSEMTHPWSSLCRSKCILFVALLVSSYFLTGL